MWDDPTRTLYYQVGIGEGNAKTAGDHDIWRLPQADDTYGGTDPHFRYIRNRPVFRAGPPGSKISPNLAGRDAAALAEAYQLFKTSDPDIRQPLPAGRRAHLRPGRHLAQRQPADRHPVQLLPRDRVAGRPRAGRHRAVLRTGGRRPARTGLPHTDPLFYLQQAAHWAQRLHHRTRRRGRHPEPVRRDRSRALRAVPGDRPGGQSRRARGHPGPAAGRPEEGSSTGRSRRRRPSPFGFGFPWDV